MADTGFYLTLCIVLVIVLLACIAMLIRVYLRLVARNDILHETVINLGRLNDRLRMDRHDYLNHLQVIYGLMELHEYDDMEEYIRKMYKELLKTGKAIKTSKPAINALLAAKLAEAESENVQFIIEVKSDLSKLRIEDWDLCKILSNLIDNALKALRDIEIEEKILSVNITETPTEYVFEVSDNGPEIPANMRNLIFKKGFTTKKEDGHGMGLAIVSEILEENGGSMSLESDQEETTFTVVVRKE